MPKTVDIDLKRNEFIAAGADVIALEGLAAASMRRIAEQAGCTTGSLTHYFASRKELLVATLKYVHHNAGARMAKVMQANDSAESRLRAVLRESLPFESESLLEWSVWIAFWNASMEDADLTKENTRRYSEWRNVIEQLLEPITSNRSLEASNLLSLIDGYGLGIARQRVNKRALRQAREECEEALAYYLQELFTRSNRR